MYAFSKLNRKKIFFLDKPVLEATKANLEDVKAVIVASQYFMSISAHLESLNFNNIFYAYLLQSSLNHNRIEREVEIGRYTYSTMKSLDFPENIQSIGAFCSINNRAAIGGGNHPIEFVSTHPVFFYRRDELREGFLGDMEVNHVSKSKIIIGNDVWIATNAVILPGVKVGDGAVIGAGAVVTKDIPPYAIAVGVPAKVIKYRFSEEIIEGLLKIKWWDWSDEKIKENINLFYDPEAFVKKFLKEVEK